MCWMNTHQKVTYRKSFKTSSSHNTIMLPQKQGKKNNPYTTNGHFYVHPAPSQITLLRLGDFITPSPEQSRVLYTFPPFYAH